MSHLVSENKSIYIYIFSNDSKLKTAVFALVRVDLLFNLENGLVCIYCRSIILLKVLDIHYLQFIIHHLLFIIKCYTNSCLNFEKVCSVVGFEIRFIIFRVISVFNGCFRLFQGVTKYLYNQGKIMEKTHQFVSHQLIKELAHILNETSLCIKLHFTTQLKPVREFGVHSFLHSNYQQQIIHAKFNLKVYYPPLYKRELWYYKKTNTDKIKQIKGNSF